MRTRFSLIVFNSRNVENFCPFVGLLIYCTGRFASPGDWTKILSHFASSRYSTFVASLETTNRILSNLYICESASRMMGSVADDSIGISNENNKFLPAILAYTRKLSQPSNIVDKFWRQKSCPTSRKAPNAVRLIFSNHLY